MTTDHSKPGPAVDRDWYAWLIDPLPTAEFERDYYEQRLLHVRRQAPAYYAELLSVTDLDIVLGTHAAGHRDIKLVRGDGSVASREYANDAGRVLPLEGREALRRRRDHRLQPTPYACAGAGAAVRRARAALFVAGPDQRVSHAARRAGIRSALGHPRRLRTADQRHEALVDLRHEGTPAAQGPALRTRHDLPATSATSSSSVRAAPSTCRAALMHSARSTDRTSLHVTLGLTAFTWTEFLVESVTAAALGEESLRRNLPRDFAREGFPAAERERLFGEKLALVQSRFNPEVVWRRFTDEVLATDVPLFTDLLGQRLCTDPLALRSRVGRRDGLLAEAVQEGETCLLRYCGRELRLPAGAWPALRFATTAEEFAVEDLPDCLDAEGEADPGDATAQRGGSPAAASPLTHPAPATCVWRPGAVSRTGIAIGWGA